MVPHVSLPGAEKRDIVPRNQWMNGVGGLLLARAILFETPLEDEQRKAEMVVCSHCKEKGMALMNPKNVDGKRTKKPTCNFAVGVSVLRKGGLGPDLQLNPKRLEDGAFKITAAKWGNSSSAPAIVHADARLLWLLYKQSPPVAYTQNLLLLHYFMLTTIEL